MEFENLPTDWEIVDFEKSGVVFIDGDRGKNYPKNDEFFSKEHCLFLTTKNLPDRRFNFDEAQYITQEKDSLLRKGKLSRNDIVITTRGTIGHVALYSNDIKHQHIRINSGMLIIRSPEEHFIPKFLLLYLTSPFFEAEVKRLTTGTAQPQLPIKSLNKALLIKPPLLQQQKIASILGALDDKIELNNQMNQTLETMAKALFQSWFVDFEPFADGEFEESELGMIPKGWRVGKLNDLCKILNGYAFKSQWWQDEGIKVVKIKNIDSTKVNIDDCQCVSDELAKQHTKFLLQDGDMLIAMTGATVGKVGVVNTEGQKLLLNQRVGKFIPIEIADAYIKTFIREDKFFDAIQNTAYGSAQPNISAGDIENMKIIVPNKQALEDFERSVSPMFQQILENNKQTSILRKTRDSLMPKLMSGEIELEEV